MSIALQHLKDRHGPVILRGSRLESRAGEIKVYCHYEIPG